MNMNLKSVIRPIKPGNLANVIHENVAQAKEENLDLVVRAIDGLPKELGGGYSVVFDFKRKVNFNFYQEDVKPVGDILAKIEELELKLKYWTNRAETEDVNLETERMFERQIQYFEGAIRGLRYVLGQYEV